jgi:hypothetical protein
LSHSPSLHSLDEKLNNLRYTGCRCWLSPYHRMNLVPLLCVSHPTRLSSCSTNSLCCLQKACLEVSFLCQSWTPSPQGPTCFTSLHLIVCTQCLLKERISGDGAGDTAWE